MKFVANGCTEWGKEQPFKKEWPEITKGLDKKRWGGKREKLGKRGRSG